MSEGKPAWFRWGRFAAEVLTIVLGVLLALAAGEARQYFADRASEREILAALRVEFAADVEELQYDQAARAQKLAAIELLSRMRTGAVASPPPEALARALFDIIDYRFYTASHPVLDDITATGRLELIRSDELRHALMVFGQERSRIGVAEQWDRDFVANQVEPFLASRLDLEALSQAKTPGERAAALMPVPELLADKTFGSLLFLNRDRTDSSRKFASQLLAAVAKVQSRLGEP